MMVAIMMVVGQKTVPLERINPDKITAWPSTVNAHKVKNRDFCVMSMVDGSVKNMDRIGRLNT